MCNGCQFLRTSLNINSIEDGDEKFNLYCMHYGIRANGSYTKEEIKKGVTLFSYCPCRNSIEDDITPEDDLLKEYADELLDD